MSKYGVLHKAAKAGIQCTCGSEEFIESVQIGGWWKDITTCEGETLESDLDGLKYGRTPRTVTCHHCGKRNPNPKHLSSVPLMYPPGTWFQISQRHCLIARFPVGSSPAEAVREHCPAVARSGDGRDKIHGDYFLRTQARNMGLTRYLKPEQFDAWRKAGGTTYR